MLTPRKAAFVAAYVPSQNATQAAISAGYSEKTAYSQGSRLLKDVEVQHALQQVRGTAVQVVEARMGEAIGTEAWIVEKAAEVVHRALNAVPVRDSKGEIVEGEWTCNITAATPALSLLAKRVPAFRDQPTQAPNQTLVLNGLSDDQLEAVISRLAGGSA